MLFVWRKHSLLILAVIILLVQCTAGKPAADITVFAGSQAGFDLAELEEGTEIRNSGMELMGLDPGLHLLNYNGQTNDSVLVIAIHGYQSQGYEWVTGLKHLGEHFGALYFFRYDWQQCPQVTAAELATAVKQEFKQAPYRRIVIFAHSYGGLVAGFAAAKLGRLQAEIHLIAAPLSGFPGLLDQCTTLLYNKQDQLVYPEWKTGISVIQHKTVHAADGAFRDLATDPQEIDLPFRQVLELPPTMDGHRLGHNWSVTWVLDQYVGKPHRY
jgi:pimeloyl-ACP methyl ester carboxylesterase